MAMTTAERQRLFRERRRAEAGAVTEPAADVHAAVTHELYVGPQPDVTEHTAIPEPVTVTRVVDDVRVEPVTPAPPLPGEVTVAFSEAELRRLDQWRRCQYDQPDRSDAIRLLVCQALGMPET